MPRYAMEPEEFPGSVEPPFWPVRVVRPDGSAVPGVLMVDTDTGAIVRHVLDVLQQPVIDYDMGVYVTATETVPGVRLEPVPPPAAADLPFVRIELPGPPDGR